LCIISVSSSGRRNNSLNSEQQPLTNDSATCLCLLQGGVHGNRNACGKPDPHAGRTGSLRLARTPDLADK
jgi:hypothetical protein